MPNVRPWNFASWHFPAMRQNVRPTSAQPVPPLPLRETMQRPLPPFAARSTIGCVICKTTCPTAKAFVREAAESVIKAEGADAARALAKQLAPLQQQVADLGACLAWLVDHARVEGVDDATKVVARRFNDAPSTWRLPSATLQRWHDARDRLTADPAAPLPK